VARIEVEEGDMALLLDPCLRQELLQAFRDAGFRFVALDLTGYRTGSMNLPDSGNLETSPR
jgi:uncharacterized protein